MVAVIRESRRWNVLLAQNPYAATILGKAYAFLSRRRRWAVLLIVLFAVVITPGDILIGSLTLALVMYGLFEVTLQLIRMMGR